MSTQPVRPAMVPVSRRIRGYFAPVDRETEQPTIFDPGKSGAFALNDPPAPWLDLGWIDNFRRFSRTVTEPVRAGAAGATAAQFRSMLDAGVEFDFREWGKLQMALACGAEHMNVLAPDPSAAARPSGGSAIAAVGVLAGSTGDDIQLGAGSVDAFSLGDLIAVDLDYQQQTGWVGSGIAAAYVKDSADVNHDADYVRRVTFNLGRVAQKTSTSLLLAQPLLAGTPATGSGAQKVVAFVDREGGSFFQEWSALFVAEEESGGRVCFYYPRLSATKESSAPAAGAQKEESVAVADAVAALALRAAFRALPYTDGNDGQTVVCYRSYFPAVMAGVY